MFLIVRLISILFYQILEFNSYSLSWLMMRRLWVLLALLTVAACYSPLILAYFSLTTLLVCVIYALYKKFIKNNKESVMALFLSAVLDLISFFCRTLRYLNFVSDVEALRAPNYLTLLLKPHPDVNYEKLQIKDDTINLILYRPKVIKNDGLIVYAHGGKYLSNFSYILIDLILNCFQSL